MSAELARRFHEAYERLAPSFGYETRAETREFDSESPNGKLMIAVCGELFGSLPHPAESSGRVALTDEDVIALARIASSENHYAGGRCVRMEFTPANILSFVEALRVAHPARADKELKC